MTCYIEKPVKLTLLVSWPKNALPKGRLGALILAFMPRTRIYHVEGGTLNMILNISGRNVDTGAAFQEHAGTSAIVEKYFSNAVSGAVTLAKSDLALR